LPVREIGFGVFSNDWRSLGFSISLMILPTAFLVPDLNGRERPVPLAEKATTERHG
jgi:hypothetical protein